MELKDTPIKNWANKIPFGFKEFTKGMSNENRLAIVSLLLERDGLRFSEIKDILNLPKNILSQHLKILLKYGLIRRTETKWDEKEKVIKSKYKLNQKYKRLLYLNFNQLKKSALKEYPKITFSTIPSTTSKEESSKIIGIAINKETNTIEGIVKYEKERWLKTKNIGVERKWWITTQSKIM